MTQILATRLKAIVGAVLAAIVGYAATAITSGTTLTLHGLEVAAAGALLTGLGVHQARNAPKIRAATAAAELPAPSGRKLGHLPSPRDDRDHLYKPRVKAPSSVHNGAGLTYDALGNLSVGDCAEAGEEHGRQIVAHAEGKTYTPTTAGTLALYSKITGYNPANPSSDQGTVLRQMLADLKAEGVLTEYQAVATDTATLKAAITEHTFVLCGFALPEGAESEGVKWRVPRSGKAAGSWGGHCVPLVGYTSETFDVVSWGEIGTASVGFVKDYLDEAWVLTYADHAIGETR